MALQFARNVIRGDDSLEDTLGDPVLFVASLRGEFGVKGFRVAALLSAFSVLNTVFKCGGQFVWTRYSFHDKLLPLRERRVTWKNGLYYLPNNKWAKLNAYRRSKAHLSPARVLSSKQGTVRSSELVDMRPLAKDFTYPTTKNVAVAAMWLGVPVRELRLLVLLDLLYNEENDLSLYAEQEGVDLADILAVGGKTGVHSREGKIITVKDRILMYPSLKVTNTAGYTFHCGWGLTRAESTTSRANKCYSYHRTNFDRHARMWKTRVCETYVSKRTLFGSLISVFQLVCFSALVRMGELHHQFNSSDARSRLRNPGTFVETREAPSCYVPSAIELKLISAMRTLIHHGRNVSPTMNNLEEHK